MALPTRLKPAARSLMKAASLVGPTGFGVLLSVAAHGALLAFGPRTDVSFASLSQAAQQAEAKETIVPLVQLSPAERNRLPSFAQPRKPPSATSLGNLSLPSGLPSVPNTSIPRRTVPANPFPSPTTPRQRRTTPTRPTPRPPAPLSQVIPSTVPRVQLPARSPLSFGRRTGIPVVPPPSPNPASTPTPTTPETNNSGSASSGSTNGSASDLLPQLEPGTIDPGQGLTMEEAIEQAGGNGSGTNGSGNVALVPNIGDNLPSGDPSLPGNSDGEAIPVPPPEIATAPAQGDTTLLIDGNNNYDPTAVSETEASDRQTEWLAATAADQEQVEIASSEISINSEFKACREEPPKNGRLGVLVNPDGSQSDAIVLKSIGYDVLNRLALRTLEYEDFGTPEVPTHYTVEVDVVYEPEDCAESLPGAE